MKVSEKEYYFPTNGEKVLTKEEAILEYKDYVKDNREEIVNEIKKIANNMIFINNIVCERIGEPRYKVMTFGLGKNHGGTGLLKTTYYNDLQKSILKSKLVVTETEVPLEVQVPAEKPKRKYYKAKK